MEQLELGAGKAQESARLLGQAVSAAVQLAKSQLSEQASAASSEHWQLMLAASGVGLMAWGARCALHAPTEGNDSKALGPPGGVHTRKATEFASWEAELEAREAELAGKEQALAMNVTNHLQKWREADAEVEAKATEAEEMLREGQRFFSAARPEEPFVAMEPFAQSPQLSPAHPQRLEGVGGALWALRAHVSS